MSKKKKQRYSSAITLENAKKLEKIVKKSEDLNTNRSELVNLILSIFFRVNEDYVERLRGLLIRKRKKIL
ncbi:MAG: hypothetical protein MASP_00966 [Candidatus Methanolliviera sp. GoM_asphalt]|nr:MAG: hypothetical protein MASP_00966 [Candidatus Methanolliviera sp. GoM_asphalt]